MQRNRRFLTRRDILKGLSATSLLPFVPIGEAAAQAITPKRLVVICAPCALGFAEALNVTGTTTTFDLSRSVFKALEGGVTVNGLPISDLRDDLVLIDGLDNNASYDGPFPGPHIIGVGTVLTGSPLLSGNQNVGSGGLAGWGSSISIDQRVANAIGQSTPFSSLELGVSNFGGTQNISFVMSYKGAELPVPVQSDPYAAFDRVFGGFIGAGPAAMGAVRQERQSVIDFVRKDLEAAKLRIGRSDRYKLDAHLEAIRSIENRLNGTVPSDCMVPTQAGTRFDVMDDANDEKTGKLQMDLLLAAMRCGLTNVGSLLWGEATNRGHFSFVPGRVGNDDLHGMTHHNDTLSKDQTRLIGEWYLQQVAYFVQQLKNTPEGSGTMLDNTVVLWCAESAIASTHQRRAQKYLLFGKLGGALATGRWLKSQGVSHNALLVSIARLFGIDLDVFGSPTYGSGPLPGLV